MSSKEPSPCVDQVKLLKSVADTVLSNVYVSSSQMTISLPALTIGRGSMKIETSSVEGLPQSTPSICNGSTVNRNTISPVSPADGW